ncbi:hypothetical protein BDV93DRAFT_91515 [Ceratobasidium sp. AG-I]|nr:hypothetical protein BDV93DRAFT_91515 [Ceratobasidium sp. AG-I]
MMTTLLERASNALGDIAHFARTPSLTDTDDSGPSDELPAPPSPLAESPVSVAAPKSQHPLLRSPSKGTTGTRTSGRTTPAPTLTRSHVRTNSRASTVLLSFQRPVIIALSQVGVLANLLRYLTWHEFRSLVMTSRAVRAELDVEDSMDVILARFVPGYRHGVRPTNQIHVSLEDLETFILSQHISLHLYPTHALTVVDSIFNTMHLISSTTERFQSLTAIHSRFVLLLRSRALAAPNPPEIDDAAIVSAASATSAATVTRQLNFPAPLFCSAPKPEQSRTQSKTIASTLTKQRRRLTAAPSISSLFGFTSKGSRRKRPLPPPVTLSRRTSIALSNNNFSKRSSTYGGRVSTYGGRASTYGKTPPRSRSTPPQMPGITEDDASLFALKPPKPWHRHHSSLPGSSASSSRGSLGVVSEAASGPAHILPTGPHDPLYATVHGRAPVLRVFAPTDALSTQSIKACEVLLFRAGLWDWIAPGDIVCNLGYVPRAEEESKERSSSDGPRVDEFGVVKANFPGLAGSVGQEDPRGWLVFTGQGLVPYFPPAPPPPDIDVLRLPGPAYYAHLGPPVGGLAYALKIPRPEGAEPRERTMRLERNIGLVRSSWGVARVWRWVWLAEFRVEKSSAIADEWAGDWTLEAMGTREGERALLDAIDGGDLRFWEFVREKSGRGRIWLRLVDAPALHAPESTVPALPGVDARNGPPS